jgi:RHS repeat-associated protein
MVAIRRQCGINGIGHDRGGGANSFSQSTTSYHAGDAAQSGSIGDNGQSWMQTTITYGYDSAGRRIEKAYDGQTVCKYLYDGQHIIAEYDGSGSLRMKSEARNTKSETNSKHESTKTETRPLGTGLAWDFGFWSLGFVSSFDIRISDLTPYYSHFDGLGSVIALTNSAGSVANLYEYSVFGEVSASDPNHPNRFLFTGREFDADTGLYYYRARYYNPYLGRFLQTDPAADGMNPYAYCGNDPVGRLDPSGLRDFDPLPPVEDFDPIAFETFEWTFPALAIGNDIKSDELAQSGAAWFFTADNWTSWPGEWSVESAHLDGTDIHVRFISYYSKEDGPPPAPGLVWEYVKQRGSLFYMGMSEPVIRVNGTGLLTQWKLDRILTRFKMKVRMWPTRRTNPVYGSPFSAWTALEAILLVGYADTPFHSSGIEKWEFGEVIYDNSEVNYYGEGYAMRHFNYWYRYAESIVLAWKNAPRILTGETLLKRGDLQGLFFWFDKGWDEYPIWPWEGPL